MSRGGAVAGAGALSQAGRVGIQTLGLGLRSWHLPSQGLEPDTPLPRAPLLSPDGAGPGGTAGQKAASVHERKPTSS